MRIEHFLSMCDDTGLLQHAVHSVPDRHHGYCVDDNARALLLACALNHHGERPLPEVLTSRFAAFVQHAWNPDTERFRNFMSFDRRWLEDKGSEDSHGRTLWALGECSRVDANLSRRRWAAALFAEALPAVERFSLATSLGVHAARVGRLPRRRPEGLSRRPYAGSACRPVDGHSVARRNRRMGLVRGRACV